MPAQKKVVCMSTCALMACVVDEAIKEVTGCPETYGPM